MNSPSLVPTCYRIQQTINEHVYYIEQHKTELGFRWLIRYGPPYDPVYVVGRGQLANYHEGFDSPEEALDKWIEWYE